MNARSCLSWAITFGSAWMVSGCLESTEHGIVARPPAYTDPTRIEMLSAPPSRAYEVVGEIQLEDGDARNEQIAETKIRTEAARFQADAVIVYGRGGPQNPKAIRYLDSTPPRGTVRASNRASLQRGGESSGGPVRGVTRGGDAFPDGGASVSR